jgi:hypothetical protein
MKGNRFVRIALVECENLDFADVVEGPKEVLDNLKQYLGMFYEYADKNYFGDWGDYDKTEHLIEFLNEKVVNGDIKVRIIERQAENTNNYKTIII